MKKLLLLIINSLTLISFTVSPAAFGAGLTGEQIYKQSYIDLKQGKDAGQVVTQMIAAINANKLDMKDVLEAAVAKGYMSQEQLNTVLDVAAKNQQLTKDTDLVNKLKQGKFSAADVEKIAEALSSNVTGANYGCHRHYRHGCYHRHNDTVVIVPLLVIVLLLSSVVVIYG